MPPPKPEKAKRSPQYALKPGKPLKTLNPGFDPRLSCLARLPQTPARYHVVTWYRTYSAYYLVVATESLGNSPADVVSKINTKPEVLHAQWQLAPHP